MSEDTTSPVDDPLSPKFWQPTFAEFAEFAEQAITAAASGDHDRALRSADELRAATLRLTATVVAAARRGGRSWSQIGRGLGMTKQSAWEKFRYAGVDDDDEPMTLEQEERHLAVVVTLSSPLLHPDNAEYGLDLHEALRQGSSTWEGSVARDLRVDHFLNLRDLTGEEYWIRVAPYDQITARFPGASRTPGRSPPA